MQNEDLLLIDKYLSDELTKPERESIDKRLLTDIEFKDLFQFVKDTNGAVHESKKQEFIKELENVESKFHSSKKEETKVFSIKPYKNILVAASVLLIVGMFSLFFFKENNPSLNTYSDLDVVKGIFEKSKKEVIQKSVFSNDYTKNFAGQGASIDTIFTLPLVILEDERYQKHYFLKDTLYLFGSFGENIIITIDGNMLNLRDGFKKYTLEYKESTKIENLEKKNN